MYVTYSQPYKHKVYNLLILVNEMHLFVISLIQIVFYTDNKSSKIILFIGWTMIALWIFNIIINLAIWIVFNIKENIRKWIVKPSGVSNIFNMNFNSEITSNIKRDNSTISNASSIRSTLNLHHTRRDFISKVNLFRHSVRYINEEEKEK